TSELHEQRPIRRLLVFAQWNLLSDCGFGDGGEHVCIPCDDGTFSSDTDVAPCRRCTQCSLLNRHLKTACSPTRDGLCGQCLPGSAPLRSPSCISTRVLDAHVRLFVDAGTMK
uniref:TNFR-Cys domain-containing protein n=1 Tax=Oryzias latipes TaxID=8090 RepID=A0A3B3IBZ0_ORYLA